MNKSKIFCILAVSILFAASITVSASEIDCAIIEVTIDDDFYGKVTPKIIADNESSITLKAVHVEDGEDSYYKVNDSISIPLDIICNKAKVYHRKMIRGAIIGYRSILDVPIRETFHAYVHEGELIGRTVDVADNISVNVNYQISEETFTQGENMTMCIAVFGTPFPGETNPFSYLFSLDDFLKDGFINNIIKEFVDLDLSMEIKTLIFAVKKIKLDIEYEYDGEEQIPDQYTIDITATNGKVNKNPNKTSYAEGTVVNITAIPDPGYTFDYWSDDLTGSENPASITMDNNKTITANFKESAVLISPKKLGITSIKINILNQKNYDLTNIEWNVSIEGGLLGKINAFSNGTIENLTTDSTMTVNSAKILFGLGSAAITINVKIPGETTVVSKHSATIIGPIILVK
jgi:uncharacterized repeat protein (TIGR02543 family)